MATRLEVSMQNHDVADPPARPRRHFIGGSDARIIMGNDEAALVRLWQEKRGEVDPQDLSGTSSSDSASLPKGSTGGSPPSTGGSDLEHIALP